MPGPKSERNRMWYPAALPVGDAEKEADDVQGSHPIGSDAGAEAQVTSIGGR